MRLNLSLIVVELFPVVNGDHFQRESATFSRHIRKIDAKAKNSDKLRDKLMGYINTFTQT
jgi:hypothetical protein